MTRGLNSRSFVDMRLISDETVSRFHSITALHCKVRREVHDPDEIETRVKLGEKNIEKGYYTRIKEACERMYVHTAPRELSSRFAEDTLTAAKVSYLILLR